MAREQRLRELAAWYREFADRAEEPWIWEARLRHAERLEREADRLRSAPNLDGAAGVAPKA
jgi:hypothetical protein